MFMSRIPTVLIGLLIVVLTAGAPAAQPRLQIATRSGMVLGAFEGGVRVFRSIPYATPPVGLLRWAPPRPPARWNGVRPADRFGASCAQPDFSRIQEAKRLPLDVLDVWIGAPMDPKGSEDCLTLNVWAPATAHRAPVMVFIYGGGGSGDIPWWNGESFARDGVVLVTFNYRNLTMGKFAHPALTRAAKPDEPLGRYDLMDQLAALKWVRNNIAGFGGDPQNVTLFGQSAGGAAVLQLLTTRAARGLFDKAIVESGNGWWAPATQKQNERIGVMLAQAAGLGGASATVEQLRAAPAGAFPQIGHFAIDGRLLRENPTTAIAAGRIIDVPLMIGTTSFDGSSLRSGYDAVLESAGPQLRAAYASAGASREDLASAIYTDRHATAPARWVARHTAGGAPTYLYQFSYVRPADRPRLRGAPHGSELPYVFDSWAKAAPGLQLSEEERAVTRTLHGCWIAFARTGRPHCAGVGDWPAYSAATDPLMEFGAAPQVRHHFRAAQLDAQDAAMGEYLRTQERDMEQALLGGFGS